MNLEYSQLNSIQVPVGTYSLTVYAYTSESNRAADKHAASGTTSGVIISAASMNSASVNLNPLGMNAGTGTFSWDIGFPDNLTKMEMSITPAAGGTGETINLMGSSPAKGERVLDAGQYRVVFTLRQANREEVVWRETLHVYQNMESSYKYTFNDTHFRRAIFTVTYNLNYPGADDSIVTSYFFDDFAYEGNKFKPERDAWDFSGWFENAEGTGIEWNFPNPLVRNYTVFAQWTGVPFLVRYPYTVNFGTMVLGRDSNPSARNILIDNTGNGTATGIVITLNNTSQFDLFYNSSIVSSGNISVGNLNAGLEIIVAVQPKGNLGQGNYSALISIDYAENKGSALTVPVSFAVVPRWTGAHEVVQVINSNDLLDSESMPERQFGWFERELSGNWLLNGTMELVHEGVQIDTQLTERSGGHNMWRTIGATRPTLYPNETWGPIPALGPNNWLRGSLSGGVGTYFIRGRQGSLNADGSFSGSGGDAIMDVIINISIPYQEMDVWFQRTAPQFDDQGNLIHVAEHLKIRNHPQSRLYRLPGGSDYWLMFVLKASATYQYVEKVEFDVHPVFRSSLPTQYYWRDEEHHASCASGCTLRACFRDRWDAGTAITITTFEPAAQHNDPGTIKIRAYNALDGVFRPATPAEIVANGDTTAGMDILIPNINIADYYMPKDVDLIVDGTKVGIIRASITGHSAQGGVLERVNLELEYIITDPYFEAYVQTITCNNVTVNMSTRKVTFANVIHGDFRLTTWFNRP
jgi:hypothetical protein